MVDTRTPTFEIPGFNGQQFHPGEAVYDEARTVFNAMIDRKPALIARCASADDVVAAVNFGRGQDLPISVYGGGHAVTGHAVVDAGLCIDLRGLKGISIDPEARTARAEAGLTWGEFDAATQEHGLAVTGGRVTTTASPASHSAAGAVGSSASSASRATTW
ncbi:MAG: FAD-dependent oxidoreductase [Dehalococcoidia bacterium]